MAAKQNTVAARLSDELYARFNDCIAAEVGATEAELAHDMGNSVTVLRSHYINRLVSRAEAEKCWRILDAVAKRLCPIVKESVTKRGASLR